MDSQEVDSFSESESLDRILQSEDLQDIVASALPHPRTPVKPALKYRVENNIPVVTADLTPRKKRGSKTPTQTRDRSSSPIGTTARTGTGKRKALFEVAVTLTAEKEIFVPVHLGDSSIDVANRVLPDGARTVVKKLAEEIEKEINAYMIGITKELASFQRLSKETLETRSKSALDRIKPPDLQTAKRARLKEKQVLGAVSVDPGNGTPWNITVREGDRAVDLAMEFCTKHGLSHAQIEDISGPIQELLNSSDSRKPLFKVQIDVGQGKLAGLEVRAGDDLHLLSTRFVEQHRLGRHVIKAIHELLVKTESVHANKRLVHVAEVVHYE